LYPMCCSSKALISLCWIVQIPHVNRQEYTLLDVSEDGYVSTHTFACPFASCLLQAKYKSSPTTSIWRSPYVLCVFSVVGPFLVQPSLSAQCCHSCLLGRSCCPVSTSLTSASSCVQLSLMDEGGNTKDDLGLPKGTADADNLADQIKKDFDDGKELVVTVLKVGLCLSCYCQYCIMASIVPA